MSQPTPTPEAGSEAGIDHRGPLLRADGVSKHYRQGRHEVIALEELSLDIHDREFIVIVGPSGCGKTTLLKIFAGLTEPTAGRVVRRPEVERGGGIGMVFQNPVLLPWRTVLRNVLLPTEILGIKGAHHRAAALLAEVGLEGFEKALPYQLSGGMQQRVAICRALLPDPPVLLMDEPFGALDAITRERLNLQLQELWMSTHKTVILVTHNIEEAIFLSDRIVVMSPRPGRIAEVITNELPRPRDLGTYQTPLFSEYGTRIRQNILRDSEGGGG